MAIRICNGGSTGVVLSGLWQDEAKQNVMSRLKLFGKITTDNIDTHDGFKAYF